MKKLLLFLGCLFWAASAQAEVQCYGAGCPMFTPATNDSQSIGSATIQWQQAYISRAIQGSKSKVLTEASATEFVHIAVPQTAGANYASGKAIWTVFFADATDEQVLTGETVFSAGNKAGTESCSVGAAFTPVLQASDTPGKDDLACTITCVTGLTDLIGLAANCASAEMTETTLTIQYRLDMTQPNTVTPQ